MHNTVYIAPNSLGLDLFLLIFILVFGGVGIHQTLRCFSLWRRSSRIMGKIVGQSSASRGAFPTIEYVVDGKTYILNSRNSMGSFFIGQEIEILYKPENPNIQMINDYSAWTIGPIFTLVAVAISCLLFVISTHS